MYLYIDYDIDFIQTYIVHQSRRLVRESWLLSVLVKLKIEFLEKELKCVGRVYNWVVRSVRCHANSQKTSSFLSIVKKAIFC